MSRVRKRNIEKRYIKFLSVCHNKKIANQIINNCNPGVIKSICNAAKNAQVGDVNLTQNQKRLFSNNRKLFNQLVNPQITIDRKRKLLTQKGGAFGFIIPILLSTVLSALGSAFIRQ